MSTTISVDIPPEVEAELTRQAAVHGRALEVHAATLLRDAAHVPVRDNPRLMDEEPRAAQAANLIELFEPMRGLLTDDEVDTLFRRNPSAGRPVDFE